MTVTVRELLDGAEAQIKAPSHRAVASLHGPPEAASLLGFVIGHEPEDAEEPSRQRLTAASTA